MGKKKKLFLYILAGLLFLTGCGEKGTKDIQEEKESAVNISLAVEEVVNELVRKAEEKTVPVLQEPEVKEETSEPGEETAIDYDFLVSKGYEILEEDITTVAGNVREHPLLKEYLKEEIEFDEDFCERFGSRPSIMEYFLYDMNQDGVDDYLVCYDGVPYVGSAGNLLTVYIQEQDTLRMVFSANVEVHLMEGGHAPIAILNDLQEGYFSFVLPYTNNRVWKYNHDGYYSEIQEGTLFSEEEKEISNISEIRNPVYELFYGEWEITETVYVDPVPTYGTKYTEQQVEDAKSYYYDHTEIRKIQLESNRKTGLTKISIREYNQYQNKTS